MKIVKRIIGITLALTFILQMLLIEPAFADLGDPTQAPQKLRLADVATGSAIGYNEYDGNYVDLKWDAVTFPSGTQGYYNIYIQEINKYGIAPSAPTLRNSEKDISGSATSFRLKNLKSGTIYYIYMTAYYKYQKGVGGTTVSSGESTASNTLRVLTDIKINAYTSSDTEIKIEWDDVWNIGGKRIDYKLYVTDGDFANTQPIFIGSSQIEPYGPVKVNQTTGKLEYTHNVGKPATVYYVKIVPDLTDTELKRNKESAVTYASTFILVRTTKMSTTDYGTIWRLDWSPVLKDISDASIKISYLVYKGTTDSTQLPTYMSTVQGTSIYVTVPPEEQKNYYIIKASVTKMGEDYFPVKIESDKIYVKEQEVSTYPSAPQIVDKINATDGSTITTYSENLKPDSASILFNPPKKGDGTVDGDIKYDIWLMSNMDNIDNPPENNKIESNLSLNDSRFQIMDRSSLQGYKYDLKGLTPNSTYYFKIVAKKTYVEFVNGELKNVEYLSQPSLKIIITPTDGPIEQPVVPGRPPIKIKKSPTDGRDMITSTSATLQIKNKWYEKFNGTKWEYVRTEKLNESDVPPYNPNDPLTPPDGINYRMVQYDDGVTLDVGVIKYEENMDYSRLENMPADWITGVEVTPNDETEDPLLNPDNLRHNIDINIEDLDENTTYIVWVRAERKRENLVSGPSDPLIITTNPDMPPVIEKPVVPTFNYNLPGDNFVDLGWDVKEGYNYYLKYGTTDDIKVASGSASIKAADLKDINFYKVAGLDSDTLYYFWIQAEAVSGTETAKSEWSDSYAVKTLKDIPPATPKGFGVKNTANAVTKNSITFEWIKEPGLQYKLEVASDINYKDSKTYDITDASEYTVTGLRSNFRYYARLYAYDPGKKLRSEPTQSVTVRTLRSSDDYDSDQDIENVITGDYIVKDKIVTNYTWNIKIIGVNADRFVEFVKNDRELNYSIDATNPPSAANKIVITISDKVFRSMSGMGKTLTIATKTANYIIRPDALAVPQEAILIKKYGDFNYEISLLNPGTVQVPNTTGMTAKGVSSQIAVNAFDGSSIIEVTKLNRPLKVNIPYTGDNWFKPGVTSAVMYDAKSGVWQKVSSIADYNQDTGAGTLAFETLNTGNMAVADITNTCSYVDLAYLSDTDEVKSAVIKIASVHPLKSVTGKYFSPSSNAIMGDAAKLMLDVMDINYDDKYASIAAKSGILAAGDLSSVGNVITREKAILMVVRVYELKSGRTAASNAYVPYTDISKVSTAARSKVRFAIENGIVTPRDSGILAPQSPVSRGELIVMLRKALALAGDID